MKQYMRIEGLLAVVINLYVFSYVCIDFLVVSGYNYIVRVNYHAPAIL